MTAPDMNRQRRTRLPAAERRETILHAATEVFAQAGYRAAKVSDVANRIGVTEPVIFQNFGSKAALFAVVLERAAADIRASLDGLADGSAAASELLGHILAEPVHGRPGQGTPDPRHSHHSHPGAAYGVLFADAAALAAEPDLAGQAQDAIRAVAAHLADLIGRAQGAAAGLAALPSIEGSPYSEAARGVFLSELGRVEEARQHFEKAQRLARTEPERRLMARRLMSQRE